MLIHHLGWVSSAAPTADVPQGQIDKCTPGLKSMGYLHTECHYHPIFPAGLGLQSKYHPYDPLWAQLSDLYGALGTPAAIAHTVVAGKNPSFVCPLLYVLTYFIRCNEVCDWPNALNCLLIPFWQLFEVKLDTKIDEPVSVTESLDERVCFTLSSMKIMD